MHRALQVYCKMLVLLAPAAACCNSDSGLPKTAPPVANKVLNDNNLAQDARPQTKSDTNATHANPVPSSIPHASTKTPLRSIWNVNWLVAKLKSFYPHYKIVKGSFHKKKNLFWGNGIDFSSPHWGQAGIGDRYFNDSQMKRALRKLRKQLKQRHAVIPKATRITFEPEHIIVLDAAGRTASRPRRPE